MKIGRTKRLSWKSCISAYTVGLKSVSGRASSFADDLRRLLVIACGDEGACEIREKDDPTRDGRNGPRPWWIREEHLRET